MSYQYHFKVPRLDLSAEACMSAPHRAALST